MVLPHGNSVVIPRENQTGVRKSKSAELSSLISTYLLKLPSELDAIVSESEPRFEHSVSKLNLPPFDRSQLGLVEGPAERIKVSNSFFNWR